MRQFIKARCTTRRACSYRPTDWWQDVTEAYQLLKDKGFEKIAVVGLSLGGVFSLKLGYTVPVLGVVPMCAPMYIKSEETMYQGILAYAREYKSVSKSHQSKSNKKCWNSKRHR